MIEKYESRLEKYLNTENTNEENEENEDNAKHPYIRGF
jgi:hypothetical protein